MLAALRRRRPGAPVYMIVWWFFLYTCCYAFFLPAYRFRTWGASRVPKQGPVLFLSNHQSFLDPVVVGLGIGHRRQFYAMARSTLWNNWFFGKLINTMNAFPVKRGESDMAAMRKSIDLLKEGQSLLVFPEGTRTTDGKTAPFATGTMLLIKRSMPMVVPVAIEGTFDAWPKGRHFKPWGRVGIEFGDPIPAQQLIDLGADAALQSLQQTVETMRLQLAQRMK